MADVPADLNSWSSTASSNLPNDNTTIGSGLADNLQALQAVVRGYLAAKGSDIASSANPDVGAVQGLYHDITGSNTIVGLGSTASAGIWKILQFDASPLLKNSTALALVGAGDITATPGAVGVFMCEATNQWRNLTFFHATAGAVVPVATATNRGIVELATNAETLTGSDTERAVTPSALDSVLGLVKLASGTVTNTAVADVPMTAYTAYTNKMLVFRNFVPATDADILWFRVSTDGGATFDTANYAYATLGSATAAGHTTIASASDSKIVLTAGNTDNATASGGISGTLKMYGSTSTANRNTFNYESSTYNSDLTGFWMSHGAGGKSANQDTDAVQLLFSTGNIGSGVWDLYGFN